MRFPIEFVGATLGASTYSKWIPVPDRVSSMCICIGWTGTDTPTGALSVEVSDHGILGTSGDAYVPAPSTNPAGSADHLIMDLIATSASYIRVVYTRSSGGSTDVFTNTTEVSGTSPTITFKE